EGMATAIPFHRAVVADPAFTADPFRVHTRWIETEFVNEIPPFAPVGEGPGAEAEAARERLVVEVGGQRLEVVLPSLPALARAGAAPPGPGRSRPRRGAGPRRAAASGDTLASPMQGTVVKVAVEEDQEVKEGDLIVVLEAMKMEQPLNAHRSGTVKGLAAEAGATVSTGAAICEIKD
ncbi:biotin/lipoyl-containing protein, partial [Streptomyces sanyensis]|uniref:biotin/lipoyl-containing protein n=1 Tax=Streptomyces sanyensis TaxID=568869 RepID=UPI0031E55F9D